MEGECIPINLGNPVTGFASSYENIFERPLNVGVLVTNIEPFSEKHKLVASRIAVGRVTWSNRVSVKGLVRVGKVIKTVQLQPVSLVDGIIAPISWVANIEFKEEPAIKPVQGV